MREMAPVVVFVALALLVTVPAVGLAVDGTSETTATTSAQNTTAPGEQLSGVAGVGESELAGDLDQRAFGLKIAQADSPEQRATIVADQLGDVDQRLSELEQRREDLRAQREAGEISDGKYNASLANIAAQTATARQLTNQSNQAAQGLPTELLEERGVDAERIQELANRADELSGPEVADRAREIAGGGVGETPGDRPVDIDLPTDRPDTETGPPGDRGGPADRPDNETVDRDTER